jgi:asparagine synthase (glutamine-hydrolysing)
VNSLRLAIVFCPSAASAAVARARIANLDNLAGGRDILRHRHPKDNPAVHLYLDRSAKPGLHHHVADDGSFLVIDGDVFNLEEMAGPGASSARPKAEILFDLYRAKGIDVFAKLDAAASVVIWDSRAGRLVIVRDHCGIVPSFYREEGGVLCWSANVPSLLQVTGFNGLNLTALDFFLGAGNCPAPWCFAEGVSKLPPAHHLIATPAAPTRVERYWQPTGKPKLDLSEQETTERLKELLLQALSRRARADEDVGVMLSAGVDSRLIAAGLRKIGRTFRAFTFRYEDYQGKFNEADEAAKTADVLGIPLEQIPYGPRDIPDNLDWMVKAHGEPFGHGLHTAMVKKIRSDDGMVLMNGTAPDSWYVSPWDLLARKFAHLPAPIRKLAAGTAFLLGQFGSLRRPGLLRPLYDRASHLGHGARIVLWGAERGVTARFTGIWNPVFYRAELYRDQSWVARARDEADALFAHTLSAFEDESERDRLVFVYRQFATAEGSTYWNHWWGRATGHEVRFPYLDHDLNVLAMQLPRLGKDKDDIRRLCADLLGDTHAYVPKIGQTVPIHHWFRGELREFVMDQLTPARIADSGVFDPQAIARLVDRHMRREGDYAFRLWPVITVLRWQELAKSNRWG